MASELDYLNSAKNVRELGVYCAKYGLTKADLELLVHEKLLKQQKDYEKRMSNRDTSPLVSRKKVD